MNQSLLTFLFVITVIVAFYAYFAPQHQIFLRPFSVIGSEDKDVMSDTARTLSMKEAHLSTRQGVVDIDKKTQSLIQERQRIEIQLERDQNSLDNVKKTIRNLQDNARILSPVDLVRLKSLMIEMQNDALLLVIHGKQLIDLNNQLTKDRQSLAEDSQWTALNNERYAQDLRVQNELFKDRYKVSLERNRDLMPKPRARGVD